MEWGAGLPANGFVPWLNSFFILCSLQPANKIYDSGNPPARRGKAGCFLILFGKPQPVSVSVGQLIKTRIFGVQSGTTYAQRRGRIRYYPVVNSSALQEVFSVLNDRLVRWYTNKYKRYRRRMQPAREQLREDYKNFPNLFLHWQYGYTT